LKTRNPFILSAPIFIVLFLLASCASPKGQPVRAEFDKEQVKISVGGKLFTCYKFGHDQKYPYFWPVNGPLTGESITTESSEPYPHHHSLFFGCDRVNGGNYWQDVNERGQILSEGPKPVEADGYRVVFADECLWRKPGEEPVIRDIRRITVTAPSAMLRFIDFEITLTPLVDVTILKTNHSLFSARVVEALNVNSGGVLRNAAGALAEQGTFGQASPWCDYSGTREGKTEGIAILQHSSNPWYPSKWFTRDYGFFSPTPMYWLEGDRLDLKTGETLTLEYRVVVHAGDAEAADMAGLFREYAGEVRFMTLDPGHFHAALVQKTMYDRVSPIVHVYAPKGPDVADHLKRVEGFNTREADPTFWEEKVFQGKDYLKRMVRERPGNVVVLSGDNGKKAAYIKACVEAGLNVLADKPMCIDAEGYRLLEQAFALAEEKGVLVYDIMTERFEITSILQKDLMNTPEVFGKVVAGTPADPALVKESVHHFFKHVAGKPIKRPAWFFDTARQGEGIVDVSTHLVDLVMCALCPGETLDYDRDVKMISGRRWATMLTGEQFRKVTRLDDFPDSMKKDLTAERAYPCYANGEMVFALKGVHAKVSVAWNYKAPEGAKDTHYSLARGTRARIEIRQGKEQNYRPELYVAAAPGADRSALGQALAAAVEVWQAKYPGTGIEETGEGWHMIIPDNLRIGHEAHFRQVTERYLRALTQGKLPEWEVPNMLTKYRITTEALKLALE
jgi:predicted dehydrogenase